METLNSKSLDNSTPLESIIDHSRLQYTTEIESHFSNHLNANLRQFDPSSRKNLRIRKRPANRSLNRQFPITLSKFTNRLSSKSGNTTELKYISSEHKIFNEFTPRAFSCSDLENGSSKSALNHAWSIAKIKTFRKHEFSNGKTRITQSCNELHESSSNQPELIDSYTRKSSLPILYHSYMTESSQSSLLSSQSIKFIPLKGNSEEKSLSSDLDVKSKSQSLMACPFAPFQLESASSLKKLRSGLFSKSSEFLSESHSFGAIIRNPPNPISSGPTLSTCWLNVLNIAGNDAVATQPTNANQEFMNTMENAKILTAVLRIQTWWRLGRLNVHFRSLKRRESIIRINVTTCKTHSRESSIKTSHLVYGQQDFEKFNHCPKQFVISCFSDGFQNGNSSELVEEALVTFLRNNAFLIDKSKLGELFGDPHIQCMQVMKAFVRSLDLFDLTFDMAIRMLMEQFRLPGEAQKIDRILDAFACAYCEANPGVFHDPSTAFVLAFSLIMLNTDLHNPSVKKKMSLPEFLRNNRGIDSGKNLPENFLRSLYHDVKCCEIRMDGIKSAKSAHIIEHLVGVEGITSQLVGQFTAAKIIKNVKHERVIFLFTDNLIITKLRPGPKYVINHLWDLNSVKWDEVDDEIGLPNSLALFFSTRTRDENLVEGSVQIHIAFEIVEEYEIFKKMLSITQKRLIHEMSKIDHFMQHRVKLTKQSIEKRYHQKSTDNLMHGMNPLHNDEQKLQTCTSFANPEIASTAPPQLSKEIQSQAQPRIPLRAARLLMQKEASANAQALAHTRSAIMRSKSAVMPQASVVANVSENTAIDVGEAISLFDKGTGAQHSTSAPQSPKLKFSDSSKNAYNSKSWKVATFGTTVTSPTNLDPNVLEDITRPSSSALPEIDDDARSRNIAYAVIRPANNHGFFNSPRRTQSQVRNGSGAVNHVSREPRRKSATTEHVPRKSPGRATLLSPL